MFNERIKELSGRISYCYYLSMKIYHSSTEIGQLRTNKVRAVAAVGGLHLQYEINAKPPGTQKLFRPSLPILTTQSGATVDSSNIIIRYLANMLQKLYGKNIQEASEIDQWLDLIALRLQPAVETIVSSLSNPHIPVVQPVKDVNEFLNTLNKHLEGKKFLVWDQISIADLSLYVNISVILANVLDEKQQAQIPNVIKWFASVALIIGNGLPAVVLAKSIHPRFKNLKQEEQEQKQAKSQQVIYEQAQKQQKKLIIPQTLPKLPTLPPKFSPKSYSTIVLDVKIYEVESDLNALALRIMGIEMQGLVWGKNYTILPMAFGINKLQISCTVDDSLVSADDVIDIILEKEQEEVQSVDITCYTKNS